MLNVDKQPEWEDFHTGVVKLGLTVSEWLNNRQTTESPKTSNGEALDNQWLSNG